MKKTFLLLCCFSMALAAMAQQQPLKVLYVGGSANWENDAFKKPEDKQQDVLRRMLSFRDMLQTYFSKVDTISAAAYTQQLSDKYDVTIFDGTPKAISERKTIKDASGRVTKYEPAGYLTEDFSKPVLFIGELGEKMGRSIGLKLDWYCLCLDAQAHSFKKEHAIFKGPFKVAMTLEQQPTPEDAFHYEYFLGKKTPATLPMWRVQTKGYKTDKNFRIGMVARPWGFEDSPDAESISSGVCAKTLDAVALGRHGNFFHWGFAASPEYMTKEAQAVMANAIVYISKFDGKGVIARKYLDRRATREYLKEKKYYATKDAYEMNRQSNIRFDSMMLAEKKEAEVKQAKGDSLSSMEQRSLSYTTQPQLSFGDFLKKQQKDLFPKFGMDSKAYLNYYDQNKDYFYSHDAMYEISIDEDVKSLGVPYYDLRLLDKAIGLLEKGTDTEKAKRILSRYTLVQFDTPAAWRKWYEANKKRMFFTETGGYYFMINTYDRSVEGNDYKKKEQSVTLNKIEPGDTDHNNAVRLAAGVVDKGNDVKQIVVKFSIHPGYHLYAYVSDLDPFIPTELSIQLPAGYTARGKLVKPSFKYYNESGTTIYTDEITFTQDITGSGAGEAVCLVSYQCCDDHICFPPVKDEPYKVVLN
ncbi:MAG: protein-disulfide reductase DsbD family protein [Candidatus Pseudobacter hemicellulosilyticus]|uniref:Protein-disulfide reductase DsbD family protein n=1 Tax=Candidatus Pseudobacter hemicellulosilyticus TaxID=3121375 RepID=A0AAJ6BIQ0_9BACT|nr:MAG: protein-disulfide reductase DsbD family protein [Pseudobacter sp.]